MLHQLNEFLSEAFNADVICTESGYAIFFS